jgi:hypothetical protein
MENKDFAVFILTHGRPDNVKTLSTLKKCGYTGKIYFIIDNEDKTIQKYIKNFGQDSVKIFDKKAMADLVDEGNNFDERRTITHARNACFEIASDLGITYFIQLDDDYTKFDYRINGLGEYPKDKFMTRNRLDKIFDFILNFYKTVNAKSIALSQGGDWIGGFGGFWPFKRKCMNSFICSTKRPFRFIGAMNEDVNTYTTLGGRGNLFITIPFVSLTQAQTQTQTGGITDMYLRYGTYCKAFTTVMMHPSGVVVSMMNTTNTRLHHLIDWGATVPSIIRESYKKVKQNIVEQDLWPDKTFKSENIIIRYKDIQYPTPEETSAARTEYEKEDQQEPTRAPVELFTEPAKPPYTGLYSVSWTYDIFEQEKCVGKPRLTGTYSECEIFIIESKQPSLF